VNKGPYKDKDIIKLEMINGFYNGNGISSVIEFVCSNHTEVSITCILYKLNIQI